MSNIKVPPFFSNLQLPDEIREELVRQAIAQNVHAEKFLAAYCAIYALGFYDGAVFVAGDVGGITYTVLARGGRA